MRDGRKIDMKNLTKVYLKFTSRFYKTSDVVDFIESLASAKSILIFMPDKLEDFSVSLKFLKKFKHDFAYARIDLCLKDSYQNLINNHQQDGMIFVTKEDVNFLGLPKKNLQHKILATDYNIVIDLNQDFHPLSTYLTQKSNAVLKICLDDRDREPFYNLYFRSQLNIKSEEKYKRLFNYLGHFSPTSLVKN